MKSIIYQASWICLGLCIASVQAQSYPVRIQLKSPVPVQANLIRITDIAEVTGGTPAERRKISGLDVELLQSGELSTTIDARTVRFRCLLAGVRSEHVEVAGPAKCLAYRGLPVQTASSSRVVPRRDPESVVIDAIRQSVADVWKTERANVNARLTSPIAELDSKSLRLEPGMVRVYVPASVQEGELTLTVMLRYPGERPVRATVKSYVRFNDEAEPPTGALIRQASLSTTRQNEAASAARTLPVIRPRDIVHLTAVRGSLRVSITDAIAMQSGRVGDMIRFKNPKSGQYVRARIVSQSQAIIEL